MMRARPPAYASTDQDRRRRFQASLEQSQQFYDAAASAPLDTKPVLLFYCAGQALKALAAAALEHWRPKSHGLQVKPESTSGTLGEVIVKIQGQKDPARQSSDYNTLRQLLGESMVSVNEEISIAELWGFSKRIRVPLRGAQTSYSEVRIFPHRFSDRNLPESHPVATAYQISGWLSHDDPEDPRAAIERQLGESFAHIGEFKAWPVEDSVKFWAGVTPAVLDVDIPMCPPWLEEKFQGGESVEVSARIHNRIEFKDLDLVWLILATLADVARYEPEFWRSCIDVDQTQDAESVAAFLTFAETYIIDEVLQRLQAIHFHAQRLGIGGG